MHHEKRVVILIGILSGICISLGFIRPFDGVITLPELVLQLSGSRGELSMSCNLVAMSFSLGGKKVPYFTSYNFKEQALRNF